MTYAAFAGVRESGLCPLFLLSFRQNLEFSRAKYFIGCWERTGKVVDTASNQIVDTIEAFAGPLLADMGIELVEVQFRREGHGWVLRFFIDKEQGVNLDDCATVSREISAYLEVEDVIDHAYHLEVSSPGAERPLKKEKDFVRFAEKKARVKMREPVGDQKVFTGILQGVEHGSVILDQDGQKILLDISKISKARLTL